MQREPHQPPFDRQETVNLPAVPRNIANQPTQRLSDMTTTGEVGRQRKLVTLGALAMAFVLISTLTLIAFIIPGGSKPNTTLIAGANSTPTALVYASTTPGVNVTPTHKPHIALPPTPPPPQPSITLPKERKIPPFCPPPTPTPVPAATSTVNPTLTTTPSPTAIPTPKPTPSCITCPWNFSQPNPYPTRDDVKAVLVAAADKYHLPHNLVFSIARLESGWNPYLVSCSYDIGLMQMKYGYWESIDLLNVPECGLTPTAYDPYVMQDNAYLGAKMLAWLTCYYSYWGGTYGASLHYPGGYSIDWFYQQAHKKYPDTHNANGTVNAASLCAADYHDPNKLYYPALTATQEQVWSCPYTATANDNTLLDIVISTYNQGMGTTNASGITNQWYVNIIEAYITQYGQSDGVG